MSKWRTVKLGDYVSFKTGKLDSNAAVPNGIYPFFTCSRETFQTNTYSFDTEAILLAGNNANGVFPIKYYIGKFDVYQRTYVIQTLETQSLLNRYLFYVLQLELELLKNLSTGATTKFLTLSILENLEVPLPPLPTQRRIAAILSAYDDMIENNAQRIKALEQSAHDLYREWFVEFRFPGHESVPLVDSGTEYGMIPQGWGVVRLGELYRTSSGGTPSRKKIEYYKNGSIHWLKTRELLDSYIFGTEECITEDAVKNSSAKIFDENTLIIAMYGATIGQLGILALPAATNQACCAVIQQYPYYGTYYIYWFLRQNREGLINLGQGAAQQNISQQVIQAYPVLKPEEQVVDVFNNIIEPMMEEIKVLQKKNKTLREARDLLLPRLVSGELDVSEIEIEVDL